MRHAVAVAFSNLGRKTVLAMVVLLVALAATPTASANAPRNGWGFAIADQGPGVPALSEFKRLGVRTYRFMLPYNVIDHPAKVLAAKHLVNLARQNGVQEIVVSFDRPACPTETGSPCVEFPSPQLYEEKVFPAVLELKDFVDVWGPANEPNCHGGNWYQSIESGGPARVAGYYKKLAWILPWDPNSKLLSPDFCDRYELWSVGPWIDAYRKAEGGFGSAIAWHPYWGAYNSTYSTTQDLISAIGSSSSAPIWVTEVGGFIKHASRGIDYGENDSYQAGAASWIVNNMALQSRIGRIYYYNLKDDGNPNWDTALVSDGGKLRQAWFQWCWATHGGQGIGVPPYTGIHPDCSPSTPLSGEPLPAPNRFNDGAVSRTPNYLNYFVQGGDGSLLQKWWSSSTGWSGWDSLGGVITTEPTAYTLHANHHAVVARGTDGQVYQRWWDANYGWAPWESLGGSTWGRPAAAVRDYNNMNLFTRANDGSMLVKWWNAQQGWSGWLGLGGVLVSDPEAYTLNSNHVAVIARGTDNQLYQRWWSASTGWSSWEALGGSFVGKPTAVVRDYNNMNIFARGTDGAIWVKWWNAQQGWSEWISLGGALTTDPTAVSLAEGHLAVFARGTDNKLYERWWSSAFGWSSWIDHGGSLASAPTAISLHNQNVGVFARATNGVVEQTWWYDPASPAGWAPWKGL